SQSTRKTTSSAAFMPSFPRTALLPQAKTPEKRVGVVAASGVRRQVLQVRDVASAQQDVIGQQRLAKAVHDRLHHGAPFLVSQALAPLLAQIVFVIAPLRVVQ